MSSSNEAGTTPPASAVADGTADNPAPAVPAARPGRRWVMSAGFGLLLVAALLGWLLTRRPATAPPDRSAAAPAAPAAPPVLAETVGEEGNLAIAVVALDRVAADTVELKLAVTNTAPAGSPALDIAQRFSADTPDRGTLAEVYLADLSHERKFFVLRDASNAPLGSRDTAPLGAGERRVLWARYPAPGDDAEVVVHVPHAEPMPNVPVKTGPRTEDGGKK